MLQFTLGDVKAMAESLTQQLSPGLGVQWWL